MQDRRIHPGFLIVRCAVLVLLALLASTGAVAQQVDPSSHDAQGHIIVPDMVMAGHCITEVSPGYPSNVPIDQQPRVTVVLSVVVGRTGAVTPERVISGPPGYELAAMGAARQWRYRPYLVNGAPVAVMTDLSVLFVPGVAGGNITHPGN